MLNKLKAFLKDDKNSGKESMGSPLRKGGPRIWVMSKAMREAFEKGGCKYNIKVVLRGMRGSGKSALLARLHEHEFNFNQYTPTPEIAAATIKYTSGSGGGAQHQQHQQQQQGPSNSTNNHPISPFESEDATIKVDVWDIVDEGFEEGSGGPKKGPSPSVSFPGAAEGDVLRTSMFADAKNIDVYRGCHGAILLADCRKPETLQYIVEEVRRIPPTCAICIALNFTDVPKEQHKITERDIHDIAKGLPRAVSPMVHLASQGKAPERILSIAPSWCSLSCKTEAGMEVLRSFFTVAVALVKLETLETQMKQIYSQVEVHQALMLQQRAVMIFEEKERAKRAAEEEDRRLHPEKYAHEEPAPPPPSSPPQPSQQQQQQQQQRQPSPPQNNQPGPQTPQQQQQQRVASPVPQQPAQQMPSKQASSPPPAEQQPPQKQFSARSNFTPSLQAPQPKRNAPRSAEEEQRLADDFYGDVSSEDENEVKAKGVKGFYDASDSEDEKPSQATRTKGLSSPSPANRSVNSATKSSNNNSTANATVAPPSTTPKLPATQSPSAARPTESKEASFISSTPKLAQSQQLSRVDDDDITTDEEEGQHPSQSAPLPPPPPAAIEEPTFDIGEAGGGVKDDFFGDDDDDEDDVEAEDAAAAREEEAQVAIKPAAPEVAQAEPTAPPVITDPVHANAEVPQPRPLGHRRRADSQSDFYTSNTDLADHIGNGSFTQVSANTSFARRSLPVNSIPSASASVASPVEVDVAALLAQMQEAIGVDEAPVEEKKEKKAKKDKSDKKEKKDKSDKKEKSDKKDKKKSKKDKAEDSDDDHASYGHHHGSGFVNYAEGNDDGGFEEMS